MLRFFKSAPAGEIMSAREAHEAAKNGEVILIDIRTPNEWFKTGLGEGAQPVSMGDPGFLERLEDLTGGDKSKKLAFICATGARSASLVRALKGYGWENLVDVSEGMMGNLSSPGWIRSGLPVKPWSGR